MTNKKGLTTIGSPTRYSILIKLQDFGNAGHRIISLVQKSVPVISVRETGQHTFDGIKSLEIIFEYIDEVRLNTLKTELGLLPEVWSINFTKMQ